MNEKNLRIFRIKHDAGKVNRKDLCEVSIEANVSSNNDNVLMYNKIEIYKLSVLQLEDIDQDKL